MANREHLFRGFCPKESGERTIYIDGKVIRGRWLYGMPSTDGRYILNDFGRPYRLPGETNDTLSHSAHRVVPETVGEWTGLTDRDGNKVFEDDMLQINTYAYDEPESDYFGIIEYGEFGNGLREYDGKEWHMWRYLCDMRGSYTTTYEAVGNVWENPELLEV